MKERQVEQVGVGSLGEGQGQQADGNGVRCALDLSRPNPVCCSVERDVVLETVLSKLGGVMSHPKDSSQDAIMSFIPCCGLAVPSKKRYVHVLTPGTCDSDLM